MECPGGYSPKTPGNERTAAGMQAARMQAAGMQAARMQAAGMQAARMQAAGMQAAGMQAATSYEAAQRQLGKPVPPGSY